MIDTNCQLASSNELDIFDFNQDQKHFLHQLIHFASKNWEERLIWYQEQCQLAIKKNSLARFIDRMWKKLKILNYSINYVDNICNKLKKNHKDIPPPDIHKNNWLHPEKTFFPYTLTSTLVFLLALSLNLIVD